MSLINQFIPVFQYIKNLTPLLSEDLDKTFVELEKEVTGMLVELGSAEHSSRQNSDALFAVCALLDEVVLDSQWKHRDEWANLPLQQKYFNTRNAGTEFFQRLDHLNENDSADQDVREIYLYALVGGFSGRYLESGEQSFKKEIIQTNYALISKDISNGLFSPIIPEPLDSAVFQVNRKKQKELAAIIAPIVIVLFIYLFFRNDLINSVSDVLSQF
jgi:type VI secretion system protein ImpK